MKFAITREHRDYFYANKYIECEGLLSDKQVSSLEKLAESSHVLFGPRDLWREQGPTEKITLKKNFVEIVNTLTQVEPIRLCADQLLSLERNDESISENLTLQEFLCIEPVACGLLLRISGESEGEVRPFPTKRGNGVFFYPDLPLPFKTCAEQTPGRFLLIVYSGKYSRYVLNPKDPHTYSLKRLGYTYGSELKNKNHPILYP